MIIKSSQRASPRQLAYHLINDDENEIITLSDQRGLLSKNVMDALDDMELISQASRCEKHLYHISINPSEEIREDQWQIAWELYETEFSLEDLPYIEVTHVKPDGRRHKHRVYSRIDIDTGNAVTLSFTKVRNEKVSRILEYYFEHPLTPGKHNRSVITYLKKEGFTEVAQRLEAENTPNKDRPVASANPREHQQQKRTKISIEEVKHDLQTAYKQSDTGHAFEIAIAAKGYLMARGDKRDIVIIDEAGGLHSPRRRLDVKAQDLRTKWQDLILEHLPTVEQVKQAQDSHRQIQKVRKENPPDEALKKLHEQRQQVEREIRELEQQLDLERQSPKSHTPDHQLSPSQKQSPSETASKDHLSKSSQKPSSPEAVQQRSSQDSSSEQPNERHLIETFLNFTLEPERGRRSSRGDTQQKNAQFQTAQTVSKTVLSLTGKEAIQERERRITSAEKSQKSPDKQPSAISRYLTGLGTMMKEKGQGVYRTADRFLAERLARYGHTPATIRRVLFRASPELMNQEPSARRSYVWRLVDRVHSRIKQQKITREKTKEKGTSKMEKEPPKEQKPKREPEESISIDLESIPSFIANRSPYVRAYKLLREESRKLDEKAKDWQEKQQPLEAIEESKSNPQQELSQKVTEDVMAVQREQSSPKTQQERYQKVTEDVLAVRRGQSPPSPPSSGQKAEVSTPQQNLSVKPDNHISGFTETLSVSTNKEQKREESQEISWLNNEESARRVEKIADNHQSVKEKPITDLDAHEHYQQQFGSDTFLDKFEQEEYASTKADKWIAKNMIYERLEEGSLSQKGAEEMGEDMLNIHQSIAENSPNAARYEDQYQYAGEVFSEAWDEVIVEQQQNQRAERSLANLGTVDFTEVHQSYQQQLEFCQAQQISQDFCYER